MALAERHQGGTGVRDGRESRLGDETDILSAVEEAEVGFDLLLRRVLVEGMERQLLDMALQAGPGEIAADRPHLFGDIDPDLLQTGQDRRGNYFRRIVLAEGGGNEIELAFGGVIAGCHLREGLW